jgi:hypothetical protein
VSATAGPGLQDRPLSSNADAALYLPFDGGRYRLMMGLMPLPEAAWIERDRNFATDLAVKRGLLETRHAEVFAALPEATAPSEELLAILAAHLVQHHAAVFSREGDMLINAATGERWNLARPPFHPLDLAGRLVQEDLCLLQPSGESHILVGASLCAPARWRLAEKLGRPLAAIHEPVPGYADKLARPVDRFFTLLKPGKPVWRVNWALGDDPTPFQPVSHPLRALVTPENAGERLWLRVERQTLRRLPETGAVLFTIRTHITRLAVAIRTPESAAELAAALREMPEDTRRYKNIAPFAAPLIAWLEARARTE